MGRSLLGVPQHGGAAIHAAQMKLKEWLTKERWCQHALVINYGMATERRCLEGGLIKCYGDHTVEMVDAKRKVERQIDAKSGYPYSLAAFNDADRTSYEDVKAVLEAADV